jgi:mannose-6-phosphate isomerase-like protein (cupin superfamily)
MVSCLFSLLLAMPQAAAAPQPRRAAPPAPVTVEIRVTDRSGNAAPGATVTAEGPTSRDGVSDANGVVSFRSVVAGSYRVHAEADGFVALEKEITVRAGAPLTTELALTRAPKPPEPPAPVVAPKTAPAPAVAAVPGEPRVLSIPDLAERSLGGRDPVKTVPIGCSGLSATQLVLVRESLAPPVRPDADEMIYLVAGEASLKLGDREQALAPGWFSVVPRGTSHSVTRKGRNPAILLSILSGPPCSGNAAATAETKH